MFYVDGTDIDRHPAAPSGQSVVLRASSTRSRSRPRATSAEFGGSHGRRRQRRHPLGRQRVPRRGRAATTSGTRAHAAATTRDILRLNPGRPHTSPSTVNYDDLYFDGKDQDDHALRGRLQPRRLHPQGQAVVLRLAQSRSTAQTSTAGLQLRRSGRRPADTFTRARTPG
ncbi:MAG: hypothetical protein M0C28_24350 [Candidatus Moduliflexus flocculans]|nr:hypothetical protein [Candidatus Moduliflexus flocculans]